MIVVLFLLLLPATLVSSCVCYHGDCVEGTCVCHRFYIGTYCEIPWNCPEHDHSFCNFRGSCSEDTCLCVSKNFGPNCHEHIDGAFLFPFHRIEIMYTFPLTFINASRAYLCEEIIFSNLHLLGIDPVCKFFAEEGAVTKFVIFLGQNSTIELYDYLGLQLRSEDLVVLVKVENLFEETVIEKEGIGWVLTIVAFVTLFVLVLASVSFFGIYSCCRAKASYRRQKKMFDYMLGADDTQPLIEKNLPEFIIRKDLFKINSQDIDLIKVIGQGGGNAMIFKAAWKKKIVAAKLFRTQTIWGEDDSFEGFVTEFCEGGDLRSNFYKKKKRGLSYFSLREKLRVLESVASALEYLHVRHIVHRDIKSDNCLLTKSDVLKLSDFGCARVLDTFTKPTSYVGTSIYMAPEVVRGENYSDKVDVYSLSIIMYEVLTENFDPYSSYKDVKRSMSVEIRVSSDPTFRPVFPRDFPEASLATLVKQCWNDDPEMRPEMVVILEYLKMEIDV